MRHSCRQDDENHHGFPDVVEINNFPDRSCGDDKTSNGSQHADNWKWFLLRCLVVIWASKPCQAVASDGEGREKQPDFRLTKIACQKNIDSDQRADRECAD